MPLTFKLPNEKGDDVITPSNLKDYLVQWDERFPLDFWWRRKHNIPFGSPSHKESSPIFQRLEYMEDMMYNKIANQKAVDTDEPNSDIDFEEESNVVVMEKEEIDNEFDNLDFGKIDEDNQDITKL